jgi:hypothetical protein
LTCVRRPHGPNGDLRALHLSFSDESGRVAFETTAGVFADTEPVDLMQHADVVANYHAQALATVAAQIAPWLELSRRREEAIARAVHDNHARLSVRLLQPGLFDRRAERVAAAQAARVHEALLRSRDRLHALDRLRRLRCGERRLLFGIRFRS